MNNVLCIILVISPNVAQLWASYQIRKIAGARVPRMLGTFFPPPRVCDPDMHHGTCVTHVPWYMPWSLTIGFLWSRRRGKTFPAFPAHAQTAILRIWQEAHAIRSDSASIEFSCRVTQVRSLDRGKCTGKYTVGRKRIKPLTNLLGWDFPVPNVFLTQVYWSNIQFSVFDSSGTHRDIIEGVDQRKTAIIQCNVH